MEKETTDLLFTIKDWLEIFYYICGGPILVIIGGIALYQIKLMKNQIKQDKHISVINSQREAIKFAIERIEFFSKNTIPLYDSIFDTLEENKYSLKKFSLIIEDDGVRSDNSQLTQNEKLNNEKALSLVEKELKEFHNQLHVFTKFFELEIKISNENNIKHQEVASEEMGFSSLGIIYVNYMELLMHTTDTKKIIKKDDKNYRIYFAWKQRLKVENSI